MAHAFKIMDNIGTIITYTDYDSIPLATLKHVISFIPDLGTEVAANEILLESSVEETTFDNNTGLITNYESVVKKYLYGNLFSKGVDLLFKSSTENILRVIKQSDVGDSFAIKNSSGITLVSFIFSSIEINSGITYTQNIDLGFRDKIAREDFNSDLENHLLLETADNIIVDNHYHPPSEVHHIDGDGHTPDEHREISLWNYKLQLLMTQERINASSL